MEHVRARSWDRHAIRAEINRRGLTLTKIADAADLSLSRISRGIMGADRGGAEAVAAALGLPFDELFAGLFVNKKHGVDDTEAGNSSTSANRPGKTDQSGRAA